MLYSTWIVLHSVESSTSHHICLVPRDHRLTWTRTRSNWSSHSWNLLSGSIRSGPTGCQQTAGCILATSRDLMWPFWLNLPTSSPRMEKSTRLPSSYWSMSNWLGKRWCTWYSLDQKCILLIQSACTFQLQKTGDWEFAKYPQTQGIPFELLSCCSGKISTKLWGKIWNGKPKSGLRTNCKMLCKDFAFWTWQL